MKILHPRNFFNAQNILWNVIFDKMSRPASLFFLAHQHLAVMSIVGVDR